MIPYDGEFDTQYLGKTGLVIALEYGNGDYAGTFPEFPFIIVQFEDDHIDGFWFEELAVAVRHNAYLNKWEQHIAPPQDGVGYAPVYRRSRK
jgi:hypothetical protein